MKTTAGKSVRIILHIELTWTGKEKCKKGPSLHCIIDVLCLKTSQELRMLSSVTINCQATNIVMNSGSQLSEL